MYIIYLILLKNLSLGNFLTHGITGFLGTKTGNNINKFSITIILGGAVLSYSCGI